MSGLTFSILGPLEVRDGEQTLTPTGQAPRTLLAALLLRANKVVPVDELIDLMWAQPPPSAANAIQVNVSRLRKQLSGTNGHGDALLTRKPGYMLRIEQDALDASRFERLADEGMSALAEAAPAIAAAKLTEALGLWRGPLLSDLMYEPFVEAETARWEEMRLAVLEERIEADLQLGKHAELIGELRSLCTEHPFRERYTAHLMLALYRSGRQADALQVFHEARKVLIEELGVQPTPSLQSLHSMILNQDRALEVTGTRVATAKRIDASTGALPLIGRDREISALDDALRIASRGRRVVVTIDAQPGYGKTRLLDEWLGGIEQAGVDLRRASAFRGRGALPGDLATRLRLATDPPGSVPGLSVIVADDVQWADASSLGLLAEAIASGTADPSLLVVLSHRPSGGLQKATLDRIRGGIGSDGEQVILRLEPITAHELVPLVDGPDPYAIAESFIKASMGVPYMLQRLLVDCTQLSIATVVDGVIQADAQLPEHFRVHAIDSISELDEDERTLVQLVCLARTPLTLEAAARISGLESIEEIVARSSTRNLLDITEEGLTPVHDLAADRVLEQMDETTKKLLLEGLAAETLAIGSAGSALAGEYLLEAGQDGRAVEFLARAGSELADRGSHAEAIPVLDAAIAALSRAGTDTQLEAKLRRARAISLDFSGLFDMALEDLKVAETLDGQLTMEVLRLKAFLAQDRTELSLAEVFIAFAVAQAKQGPGNAQLPLAIAQHASLLAGLGFPDEAETLLTQVEAFPPTFDPAQRFERAFWLSTVPTWQNDVRRAETALRDASALAEPLGESAFVDVGRWVALSLFLLGRVSEALRLIEECLRVGNRNGSMLSNGSLSNLALGLNHCGLYSHALAAADEELVVTMETMPRYEMLPRCHRGIALLGLSRLDEARDELENAIAIAPGGADGWYLRSRCEVQLLRLADAAGNEWPAEVASALTRELRRSRFLIILAELLTVRAKQESDPDLAMEAAQIGLDIGAPLVSARGVDAAGAWATPLGGLVVRRIQEVARNVPAELREEWVTQPSVAYALAAH
jgi:DNA-binding SARP family transcriptional activator